ncbi:MAG: hypothetical protein ACFFB0_13910 [Promethearchaeota archaeon]
MKLIQLDILIILILIYNTQDIKLNFSEVNVFEDCEYILLEITIYIKYCLRIVDCNVIRDFAETLSNLMIAKCNDFTCSDPRQKIIKDDIAEQNLNRFMLTVYTKKIHELTYRVLIVGAGLNP